MNDLKEKIKGITQKPKFLMIIGILGMVLILVSSVFDGGKSKNEQTAESKVITAEEYRLALENNVSRLVERISGDKNPTVVITLESSVRYSYADSNEIDTEESNGDKSAESRESKKQSYITVKSADGGEQALVVTEMMPEIRGVAIVCSGGDSTAVAEKIESAVTAALNITSKRVYIAGGISNEKR